MSKYLRRSVNLDRQRRETQYSQQHLPKATAQVSFVDGDGRSPGSRVADQFQHNITVIHRRDTIAVSSATPQRPRLGDIDINCYFSQESDFCAFLRGPRQWTGPEDS